VSYGVFDSADSPFDYPAFQYYLVNITLLFPPVIVTILWGHMEFEFEHNRTIRCIFNSFGCP